MNLIKQNGFQLLLESFPAFIFDIFPTLPLEIFHGNAPSWCLMESINDHRLAECNSPPGFLDKNLGKILVKNIKIF